MTPSTHPLQRYLDRGLAAGLHRADSAHPEKCCLLEAVTLARGLPKSDDPDAAGLPDWRALNDAAWSSEAVRAAHMGGLALAYWDWAEWSPERQLAVVSRAVVLTVQRVISALPGLTDAVRERCRGVRTLDEAAHAAHAARAAEAAAEAARAAEAAEDRDSVLVTACGCWLSALEAE